MSTLAFVNGRVIAEQGVLDRMTASVADGFVSGLKPLESGSGEVVDLEGGWLVPGFVDTQVNGGGGVLFNDDVGVDAIAAIGAAHAPYGTTAFLPTLISDELSASAKALDAVDAAIEVGIPGVVGVHLEGPFLNPLRKGVHEERHFRRLDPAIIELLSRPRRGVVMVTLAPELCGPGDVAALAAAGVRVSAGHTDATYDQMTEAMDEGLVAVTHLFNAMSPLHHRDLGVVGAALESGRLWCGLIADGAHVHPGGLRLALRSVPPERLMLVTDAMPSVGAASKNFVLQGKAITVVDGIPTGPDGTLAGSDLDMAQAVQNMVGMAGASVEAAVAMAAANPSAFLGVTAERGAISVGRRADWVWLDEGLRPRETWIGGRRVSSA